jgi:hypothetical protein
MSPLIKQEVDAVLPASPAAPSSAVQPPYLTPRGRPASRPTSRPAQSSRICSPLPGTRGILDKGHKAVRDRCSWPRPVIT